VLKWIKNKWLTFRTCRAIKKTLKNDNGELRKAGDNFAKSLREQSYDYDIVNKLYGIKEKNPVVCDASNESLHKAIEHYLPPLPRSDPWFGVDEKLPRTCPNCGSNTVPSKIDDRLVACLNCKLVFATQEAMDDPNIQRDLTHANAGMTPKITPTPPPEEPIVDRISAQDVMDVLHIRREIELDQARAFGEGYTRGKYGMSRAEYNAMKQLDPNLWRNKKKQTKQDDDCFDGRENKEDKNV
jgi:hypothetical protein